MRKIKQLKRWGVYQLNEKEVSEYGFAYAVIHPDVMGCGLLSPSDSDIECETLDRAIEWINLY
jgi:hypothetical protein